MLVIFLVARTVPPGFFYHGLKLRVVILAIGDWPEMAKIQDEPRNGNFFMVAPGVLLIRPFGEKNAFPKQKLIFGTNY